MSKAIYLLSNDLRLDDNRALARAAQFDQFTLLYCVDPQWFKPNRYSLTSMGARRWRFVRKALDYLAGRLELMGQRLEVMYTDPLTALREALSAQHYDAIVTQRPQGWYERQTLRQIKQQFLETDLICVDNYTLFDEADGDWLTVNLAKQYTPFRRLAEQQLVPAPLPMPDRLPPPVGAMLVSAHTALPKYLPKWLDSDLSAGDGFVGGESAAAQHVQAYFASAAPSHYKQTRNGLGGWDSSSKWSVWLAQGCVSVRRLYQCIADYEARCGANDSTQWLRVELLWREYFQWLARKIGTQLFAFNGLSKRAPLTSFYAERFRRWCDGTTPYPLVNACMQELASTGYMSNRGRQIVASCLVNELQVDWRYGAAWFEQQLLDYDVANNWGNWQYIAGVGVDPRGGRHFDLAKQQRQFDPDSRFIRQWLGDEKPINTPLDSVDMVDWPIA
ncbi:MAG: DASH family cryptochrome [Pontibacterium sp.]